MKYRESESTLGYDVTREGISRRSLIGGAVGTLAAFGVSRAVAAEEYDLEDMSLDELNELLAAVEQEISSRVNQPTSMIYSGTYEVGVDIKSGMYTFTATKIGIEGDYTSMYIAVLTVDGYNDITTSMLSTSWNWAVSKSASQYITLAEGETCAIRLEDTNYLIVIYGEGVLVPFSASWAIAD